MCEMDSLWDYQEDCETEQLGQKLLFTTLEIEKLKSEMNDEMKKNNEYIKQLIHLVKLAIQQRDEARNQLQSILNNTTQSITESNSPSEPYNNQSHPHDLVVNQPLIENSNALDQRSVIIDSIAKERALPKKGKLLQSVIEAGPLLHTLMLAGSMPTWRNPPQMQPFQIPPVEINGCDSEVKPGLNVGRVITGSGRLQPYAQMSCGTAQVPMSYGIVNDNGCFRFAKRQRFS